MKQIRYIFLVLFFAAATINGQGQEKRTSGYNVLFIFVDDLRAELGCYGNPYIHSPNIDQLAANAIVFKNQFVTVPTCGASRSSILRGMLPKSSNDISNEAFEHRKPEKNVPESFVHALRNEGYYTVGIGKVSHSPDGYVYPYLSPKGTRLELPQSWDEMLFNAGKWGTGWNAFFGYADGTNRNQLKNEVKPYEVADVEDHGYPDGLSADLAVKKIQELSDKNKPFFMGLGFFKPHLPFNAPKKYWDLYDESDIALTPSPQIPLNVSLASFHQSGEFNAYKLGEEKASLNKPLSDAYARKLRHGYYASISYVDAQIGKVLAALKNSNLEKNTIVVLWGDHGWHLGDDRVWGKHTISEYALKSPLIIKIPGVKGASCDKVISSIDVYPTLMELCKVKNAAETDGRSLVPLLRKPNDKKWNNVAYSYFKKGITVRTDQYRFTRYFREEQPVDELYDHRSDPYENVNIAQTHQEVVNRLIPIWSKGNTDLYRKAKTVQKHQ